jgi:hypothetical protein
LNMLKLSLWRKMAAILLALVVSACGGQGGSASPPTDFKVTTGNGQVIVTWTGDPGAQYWLMYAQTTSPLDISNPPAGHFWAPQNGSPNLTSPLVLTGLTNGLPYAFAMNGRTDGGKGGPQTASLSATPRPAGSNWTAGTGTVGNLHGLAFGTSSADSLSYYLAVGDSGVMYKALDGVSQSVTGYSWTTVTGPGTPVNYKAALNVYLAANPTYRFIAVGDGGANSIVSSPDLVSWTYALWPNGTPPSTTMNALASNGTTVVVVGDGGTAYSSTDGLNWTAVATGVTSNLYGVAYSSILGWVAVGQGGTLITSPDLATWTVRTANAGANDLNAIAITSGGVAVAVGNGGTVVKCSDAIGNTWVAQTLGATTNLYAVNTDSVQFLAVGAGGAAFTSTDWATWVPATSTGTTNDLLAVYGTASKYMVAGKSGTAASSIN